MKYYKLKIRINRNFFDRFLDRYLNVTLLALGEGITDILGTAEILFECLQHRYLVSTYCKSIEMFDKAAGVTFELENEVLLTLQECCPER